MLFLEFTSKAAKIQREEQEGESYKKLSESIFVISYLQKNELSRCTFFFVKDENEHFSLSGYLRTA